MNEKTAPGDKAFFDWWPFAFDPECDGMARQAWNAATAAKDTEITALTSERDAALAASRYETDLCGQALTDLKAMTAERDVLRECTDEYDAWIRFNDAGNGSYPDFLAAMTKDTTSPAA
jgi:hypothetical protein